MSNTYIQVFLHTDKWVGFDDNFQQNIKFEVLVQQDDQLVWILVWLTTLRSFKNYCKHIKFQILHKMILWGLQLWNLNWTPIQFILLKESSELTVNFQSGSSTKSPPQWYKLIEPSAAASADLQDLEAVWGVMKSVIYEALENQQRNLNCRCFYFCDLCFVLKYWTLLRTFLC